MNYIHLKKKISSIRQEKQGPQSSSFPNENFIKQQKRGSSISLKKIQIDNAIIFSRLKETPTFHLSKGSNHFQSSKEEKKATPSTQIGYLKYCNVKKIDTMIKHDFNKKNAENKTKTKMFEEYEKNMLYFNRNRVVKKDGPTHHRTPSQKKSSLIYKQFFNKPNLNQILNLSDLIKQKKFQMNILSDLKTE